VSEFARIVLEVRPRWFVLENVPGLVSPSYRGVLETLYTNLEGGGYQVAKPWILNAGDYGVPQERRRIFVVGARAGEELPSEPKARLPRISVGEALDDLGGLARFRRLYEHDRLELSGPQLIAILRRQSGYVRRLNGLDSDREDRSDPRSWNPLRLSSVGLTRHSDIVAARLAALRPGERDGVGRLPRLDRSAQSPTLRAGTGRDHGSFTSARPVHPVNARVITVREAARLHGFPDWFGFQSTKWHGFRQVGNAVPPPLARAVATTVVRAANLTPTRRGGALQLGSDELLEMALAEAAEQFELDSSRLPVDVRRTRARSGKEAA
jgi:DNA (cytosine-5)-methyltransferase 1